MNMIAPWAMLVGRVLISYMFIMSGWDKVTGLEGTQGYMEMVGVPGILIYPTILVEILGGLAVLIGYQTRIAALLLAGFCVLSGFLFHFDLSDGMQVIMLNKNIAIAGGFLFLVAMGPGSLSIEGRKG
ncbi:DoxX family protein [Saccharospirillum sp. MSK14-1]|uniref:DoxX family protein n=1 Tax=Saccharospirillum sp. MSK14-1 TaxID=1897632 RepID=UPI000D3BAE3B|nr:DoxX family protein [Saccharospirillum sp. MSK14-1]PTY35836.1 DoxX family protein [Saccharospirillum sp. MSK14-1]